MYLYDELDRTIVAERIAEFRDQVGRRISGALTEEEFKPLRLMNGVYLQLHAYMLRISIPYGTLSSRQLRMLAHVGRRYDRNYGHFTTRQNIQFNWIKLEDLPDATKALATLGSGESVFVLPTGPGDPVLVGRQHPGKQDREPEACRLDHDRRAPLPGEPRDDGPPQRRLSGIDRRFAAPARCGLSARAHIHRRR